MTWEREYHHINLDEGEHRIGLIERSVQNVMGEPTRYVIQIQMGSGAFEYIVGRNAEQHHVIHVKLGGDFTIKPDGSIEDSEGNVFDPRDFEKKMTLELNKHHELLRAYGRKHNAPEFKVRK
jgi:hypothetical protein